MATGGDELVAILEKGEAQMFAFLIQSYDAWFYFPPMLISFIYFDLNLTLNGDIIHFF